MADMTKVLHVSKHTYDGVVTAVCDAIRHGKGEIEQMNGIISLFPTSTPEQIFIAGYTIGRLAEMENQRRGRHERYIYLNINPDEEPDYADKRDK